MDIAYWNQRQKDLYLSLAAAMGGKVIDPFWLPPHQRLAGEKRLEDWARSHWYDEEHKPQWRDFPDWVIDKYVPRWKDAKNGQRAGAESVGTGQEVAA